MAFFLSFFLLTLFVFSSPVSSVSVILTPLFLLLLLCNDCGWHFEARCVRQVSLCLAGCFWLEPGLSGIHPYIKLHKLNQQSFKSLICTVFFFFFHLNKLFTSTLQSPAENLVFILVSESKRVEHKVGVGLRDWIIWHAEQRQAHQTGFENLRLTWPMVFINTHWWTHTGWWNT